MQLLARTNQKHLIGSRQQLLEPQYTSASVYFFIRHPRGSRFLDQLEGTQLSLKTIQCHIVVMSFQYVTSIPCRLKIHLRPSAMNNMIYFLFNTYNQRARRIQLDMHLSLLITIERSERSSY